MERRQTGLNRNFIILGNVMMKISFEWYDFIQYKTLYIIHEIKKQI